MTPEFEIFTSRLHLRILRNSDSHQFAEKVSSSASLHTWLDWCHHHFDSKEAHEFIVANRLNWIKNSSYGFGIFERNSDRFLGMVALTEIFITSNMASLGYWVADQHQHCGYAKEAVDAIVEMAFDQIGLTRLEIVCDRHNLPSHNVARCCGAVEEGVARNRFIFSGQPKDGLVFSIIPK